MTIPSRSRTVFLLSAALALIAMGPDRVSAQDAPSTTLEDVSTLIGCWAGTMGGMELREEWTSADGGLMLGTTRYFREGRIVDFEFARMQQTATGVELWPYPRGTISEHGFPLVRTEGELVFENLEHDFPVRIVYAPSGPNAINPRIEGSDGEARGWSVERVACHGGH